MSVNLIFTEVLETKKPFILTKRSHPILLEPFKCLGYQDEGAFYISHHSIVRLVGQGFQSVGTKTGTYPRNMCSVLECFYTKAF